MIQFIAACVLGGALASGVIYWALWVSRVTRAMEQFLLAQNVYWYARVGIKGHRHGVFRSQITAWKAVSDPQNGPLEGATVWCEPNVNDLGK